MVLEEFGSSKQLIVNCQPQDEGATTVRKPHIITIYGN